MPAPSVIIAALLVEEGFARWPDVSGEAPPVAVGGLPDNPPDAFSVADTVGRVGRRNMNGGAISQHPGIQITRRSRTYPIGHDSLVDIHVKLAKLSGVIVAIPEVAGGGTAKVNAITSTSGIFSLGRVSTNGEFLFTFNAVISIAAAP